MKLIIEIEGEFEGVRPELDEDFTLKCANIIMGNQGWVLLSEEVDETENWAFSIECWTARWEEQ